MMRVAGFILLFTLTLQGCSTILQTDPRSGQQQWQDQQIAMQVGGLVNKPPYQGKARVNAFANEGKVLLVGQALDQATAAQLIGDVKKLNSVKLVHNQLLIGPLPTLADVGRDSWLTTKVKAQLIASKKLRDSAIKVATENQRVYLLGFVTREQGNIAAEIARNVEGVQQVIKAFEYLN
ncbi:BON domain-containing protein [Photobacterium sp. 1_MG-2023]|uniref:BON domain-containing protein n=1 Tax=Photobacterium sp. 1_MG-2023 TaxID=3062646 RepID=UPI0034C6B0E2